MNFYCLPNPESQWTYDALADRKSIGDLTIRSILSSNSVNFSERAR